MSDWPFVREVDANRPNWVASVASDASHQVDPFLVDGTPAATLETIEAVVTEQPRTRIVEQTDDRIRAEFRSLVFRFVDDVEFVVSNERVEVLSASRLGYSDLGVNRRRVELLRDRFETHSRMTASSDEV